MPLVRAIFFPATKCAETKNWRDVSIEWPHRRRTFPVHYIAEGYRARSWDCTRFKLNHSRYHRFKIDLLGNYVVCSTCTKEHTMKRIYSRDLRVRMFGYSYVEWIKQGKWANRPILPAVWQRVMVVGSNGKIDTTDTQTKQKKPNDNNNNEEAHIFSSLLFLLFVLNCLQMLVTIFWSV